jgi:hypothetical protein
MDSNGGVLQKNDDAGSPDARVDYTFGAAGDYVLKIEDLLEHGGADFVYRVTATQPMPNFEAKVINDTPRVPRSGRTPVRCEFARLNNFNEAVRITAEDLPLGLYAEPLILTPNHTEAGLLFISAREDAQLGSAPLHLKATAMINGKLVTHSVGAFAGDRAVQSAYLTVIEAAPFMIYPGQLLATVEQDQTTTVEALVERSGSFTGEIKVSVEGFSAGREALTKSFDYQPVTIKANESHANISLKAKVDSETGARMIVLRGDATVNGQAVNAFSAPIPLAASEIPFVLATTMKRVTLTAVPPGSQSSAGEAVFGVKATRRAGFKGEIALQLEGVPDGITATVEKIGEGAGESSIKLVASDKAAVGKETQLVLTGAGVFRDKNYKFKPQPIALQINAPEAVEIKTAEVKTAETAANSAK